MLFLSEKDLDRNAGEVKMLPHLILDESAIRVLDVLRKIAVKSKGRCVCGQLLHVLDLYVLPLSRRRWSILDDWEHRLVQLVGLDALRAVLVDF